MSAPGEPLFSDFEKLLKFMELYSKIPLQGEVDPEIEKQLEALEDQMAEFKRMLAPDIAHTVDPRNLTPKEKKLIAKWSELGMSAIGMAAALEKARLKGAVGKEKGIGPNTKKSIQARKKKFKGLQGGGEKWKKL